MKDIFTLCITGALSFYSSIASASSGEPPAVYTIFLVLPLIIIILGIIKSGLISVPVVTGLLYYLVWYLFFDIYSTHDTSIDNTSVYNAVLAFLIALFVIQLFSFFSLPSKKK